jgi:hypothetical protein
MQQAQLNSASHSILVGLSSVCSGRSRHGWKYSISVAWVR